MGVRGIDVTSEQIAEFCRRNRIRKLSFFGSVLRDDFSQESDVDVLVEFQPGAIVGLITYGGIALELGDLLGREVDMHTEASLSKYIREDILATAEVQYAGE